MTMGNFFWGTLYINSVADLSCKKIVLVIFYWEFWVHAGLELFQNGMNLFHIETCVSMEQWRLWSTSKETTGVRESTDFIRMHEVRFIILEDWKQNDVM